MSFGDQHNPYGQPQQPAPGYAYPQQPGQPYAPFPQAAGGYPAAAYMSEMPGLTKAARVMMFAIASVHVVLAGVFIAMIAVINDAAHKNTERTIRTANGDEVDADTVFNVGKGVFVFLGVLAAIFAIIGFILAARYGKGGNGVRVGSIVYTSFGIISGFFTSFVYGLGVLVLVMSILVIVFCAKQASAQWFQRPRY